MRDDIDDYDELNFTNNRWNRLYDTVDSVRFKDEDSETIYKTLEDGMHIIPFGEYLRRYIYRKSEISQPYADVPLSEYQEIIKGAFSDNNTEPSFNPDNTAKLSALAKNWLTQQTVNRKVVFLLGFGLRMSVEDVNAFLQKALCEQGINAKDPFEVICWYCYKNGYGYLKYEDLWEKFCNIPPNSSIDSSVINSVLSEETNRVRKTMFSIRNEEELMSYVSKLKTPDGRNRKSVTAKACFDDLYSRARDLVANLYNETEEELLQIEVSRYRERLLSNERISDVDRKEKVARKMAQRKVYIGKDINAGDLERVISSAIPVDKNGNLVPSKKSTLNAHFSGKRFSRQHISDIVNGKAEVTRFDLITLNFFIYSQTLDEHKNAKERFISFMDSTNEILERCFLGELLISNPYESFVLMCILSIDPMGTYADVWEMSYQE